MVGMAVGDENGPDDVAVDRRIDGAFYLVIARDEQGIYRIHRLFDLTRR